MDKRWIYILIIFIIGVACSYLIVENSNNVGTANVYVNKFTATLPDDFNVEDQSGSYLQIINRKTLERIQIKDLGKDRPVNASDVRFIIDGNLNKVHSLENNSINYEIMEKIANVENNENFSFIEYSTFKYNGTKLPGAYYEKIPDSINRIVYFTKNNHTFLMECTNFHDNNTIDDNINFLINSLKPDYKQKQD